MSKGDVRETTLPNETVLPMAEPAEDNWRHRAQKMRCRSCMWFVEKRGPLGRCRKKAPTLEGWPAVFESDWCGSHKLDEGAVVR